MTDRNTRVDIVIPSAGPPMSLMRCLASVHEHVPLPVRGAVVVVDDNGTRDLSAVRDSWPQVSVVAGGERGPGPARNLGAAMGKSPSILFVDDDMELMRFDETLLPCAALTVGRLDAPAESPAWLHRTYTRGSMVAGGKAHDDAEIPGAAVSSGALLVARDLFLDIGGFPDTPHGRWEDVLFGIAAEDRGVRAVVTPRLRAVHHFIPQWPAWLGRLATEGGNLAELRPHVAPHEYAKLLAAAKLSGGWESQVKNVIGHLPLRIWTRAPRIGADGLAAAAAFAHGFRVRRQQMLRRTRP